MKNLAPLSKISLFGREIYILRDDLLGDIYDTNDPHRELNGNKARKLAFLQNADLGKFDEIISHGSNQSNAMYALSVFAKIHRLKFRYVISHLGQNLRTNSSGNLKSALENGMELKINENRREFALSLRTPKSLFIEEGVAMNEAQMGFKIQADEISAHAKNLGLKFDIFLPSGTGMSAASLAKFSEFGVFTCPCVGDSDYLKSQILALNYGALTNLKILNPPQKFHFAKPNLKLYEMWQKLNQTGINFDMIYDPVGFLALREHLCDFRNPLLYIHQGGIKANTTQLARYKYKFRDKIV